MEIPSTLNRARRNSYSKDPVGQSHLTHLHLITKEDGELCELCDKELTIKHITVERLKFNSSRKILENPSTIQQVLGEENSKNIQHFFTNTSLAK